MEIVNGHKIWEQHPFHAPKGTIVWGVFPMMCDGPKLCEFSTYEEAVAWCERRPKPWVDPRQSNR